MTEIKKIKKLKILKNNFEIEGRSDNYILELKKREYKYKDNVYPEDKWSEKFISGGSIELK